MNSSNRDQCTMMAESDGHGSEGHLVTPITVYRSPARLVVIIAFFVFISEAFVMVILSFVQPLSTPFEVLFDSILLVILLAPVLYFFLFRPFALHITARERAEKRIAHLNAVLRAIRNVSQLIVREKDRTRLLQSACSPGRDTRLC
ncbi:MAG: hypothetical protein SXV54_27145 [Chloroflexota bacterium]|nr:hypothetical protein [Chloroflexota bacterium]